MSVATEETFGYDQCKSFPPRPVAQITLHSLYTFVNDFSFFKQCKYNITLLDCKDRVQHYIIRNMYDRMLNRPPSRSGSLSAVMELIIRGAVASARDPKLYSNINFEEESPFEST